ncbi:TioE family transcriptional regulator [Prauserella cavernicola]|uniref:TioE family transcriptional regulator n=1 Tax=Prauserella cavernicola TaxID=2800127 RepID=A0A934QYT9_9PSEU|nr:TioE family transcriptional regulator [Prauserella cavernicola]MBK1789046.1 TioE family transcriptional regulator [Prauserella cavernicola]
MKTLRPTDLAREHGISTQAVRNYERDGFLPAAERTASGYRMYTEVHVAALRAYLALLPAYGYAVGGEIMTALNGGALDEVLTVIDRGHSQLLRDRETLDAVRLAVGHLTEQPRTAAEPAGGPLSVGELARRLRVTPATLRNWESHGVLTPERDQAGYRRYHAVDVRDAELAHLLRRGGYLLEHIAGVVEQIRTAGGTEALADALGSWQAKLTAQGLAMLHAATRVGEYLALLGHPLPRRGPALR